MNKNSIKPYLRHLILNVSYLDMVWQDRLPWTITIWYSTQAKGCKMNIEWTWTIWCDMKESYFLWAYGHISWHNVLHTPKEEEERKNWEYIYSQQPRKIMENNNFMQINQHEYFSIWPVCSWKMSDASGFSASLLFFYQKLNFTFKWNWIWFSPSIFSCSLPTFITII